MKFDSVVLWDSEKTFRPRTLAPGAAPVTVMSHGLGSEWLELTYFERSKTSFPCAAIEPASRNDSPAASAFSAVPSPVKSTAVTTGEPAGELDEAYFALRWKSGIVVSIGPAMYTTLMPLPV